MKIAITGGEGLLATELGRVDNTLIGFSKSQVDVRIPSTFSNLDPYDCILHTAALKDVTQVEGNETHFISTNIIGTANLSNYCIETGKMLVYISTDYVYPGAGSHKETDNLNPFNIYAWSKLGGECSVKFVKDHLIIRTSFGSSKNNYSYAFDNFYTSKDYVDIIAPLILKAIKSNVRGVINIGTERKSVFDWVSRRSNVKPGKGISKDFSLNLNKLDTL